MSNLIESIGKGVGGRKDKGEGLRLLEEREHQRDWGLELTERPMCRNAWRAVGGV